MSAITLFWITIIALIFSKAACTVSKNKNEIEKARLENAHSIELIKVITKP